jgi:hypothetical protein
MALMVDPCLTAAEHRLRDVISEVSEKAYYAGWMQDAEFEVWRLAHEGGTWGHGTAEELASLLGEGMDLANQLDRWIVWSQLDEECDNQAMPLSDWKRQYTSWREGHPGSVR